MNTFQEELIKLNQGNANNLPQDDGYQPKISSMQPPNFQPTATNKESQHINSNPVYKLIKGTGAAIGTANIKSKLTLLKDSPVAKAAPVLNIITGLADIFDNDNETRDKVAGGARGASGITALLGMAGKIPAVAEVAGLAVGKGGALASVSTGVASAGAVLGAGAAGYGVGKLIDNGVGELSTITGVADHIDKKRGYKRKANEKSKYNLSHLISEVLVSADQSTSTNENGELNYKDTYGYKINEMLTDKKDKKDKKKRK